MKFVNSVVLLSFVLVANCVQFGGSEGFGRGEGDVDPDLIDGALGEFRPLARGEVQNVPSLPSGTLLGVTEASLGDTDVAGFWMDTPLVRQGQNGRVVFGEKSLELELRPADDSSAGSLMSLEAMQALGAPITGFIQLQVFVR